MKIFVAYTSDGDGQDIAIVGAYSSMEIALEHSSEVKEFELDDAEQQPESAQA